MKKRLTTRRGFLKKSAAVVAAGAVVPSFSFIEKATGEDSPNNRFRVGCVGVGSMGNSDAHHHAHTRRESVGPQRL